MRVSQNGLNSLLVTWTPSEGPDVTGYAVYYQQLDGGQSDSLVVNIINTSTVITGLMIGVTSVSVSASSSTLSSIEIYGQNIAIGIATNAERELL